MKIRTVIDPNVAANIALYGSMAGAAWGATELIHHVNHAGQYNAVNNKISAVQFDNETIAADLLDSHLTGFAGSAAVRNHLLSLQHANDAKIATLAPQKPKQVISQIPEILIEGGSGLLAGVAVFAVLYKRGQKAVRNKQPSTANG